MRPGSRRVKALFVLVLAATSLFYAVIFVQLKERPVTSNLLGKSIWLPASDLCDFYRAGRMVLAGDRAKTYDFDAQTLYSARLWPLLAPTGDSNQAEEEAQRLTYIQNLLFYIAPYVLLIFTPLALLSYANAFLVWYLLNVAMLVSVPFLLRTSLHFSNKIVALALLATPMFFPVELALGQGQLSILLLFLLTLAFRELSEGHDFRAGGALAVACFKPQFVLPMLLVMLVMNKWKVITGFLAASVALFGISVALVGWHTTLQYPVAMFKYSRLPVGIGENPEFMYNLRGFAYVLLHSKLPNSTLHTGALVVSALMMLLVAVPFLGRRRNLSAVDFSFIVSVTLLASYHSYIHDMALLVLPLLLVAGHIAGQELTAKRIAIALTAGALFMIPSVLPLLFPVALLLFAGLLLFDMSELPVHHGIHSSYAESAGGLAIHRAM